MKAFLVTIVIGASSLAGGTVMAAPQPARFSVANQVVLVAENPSGDFSSMRDEYLHRAQNEVRSWRKRMAQWTAEAEGKTRDVHQEARQDLDKAWSTLQADWQKLQKATPSEWDEARASFDDATQRLKGTWQKFHPES